MCDFTSGTDTAGTKIKFDSGIANLNRSWLNIGKPCSSGMLFGMAYFVPKANCFTTDVTLDCQFKTSLIETLVLINGNII